MLCLLQLKNKLGDTKLVRIRALSPKKIVKIRPIRISVFDIETIRWTEPYACGFYNGKHFDLFKGKNCIKEFIKFFLTKRHRNSICFAHNGGKFDFSFILQEICSDENLRKNYLIEPMRAGSRIIQIKISKPNCCWILRDSYAILGFSLKKLTENFDVENKKGDFEHSKIHWRNWKQLESEWLPYLMSDCKGLHQVVIKFEQYINKKFSTSLRRNMTIAQLSLDAFRIGGLDITIPQYESREDKIRKSYYGGRTEIFKMYGENLNYYDVNSLYPTVMEKEQFPVGIPMHSGIMTTDDFGVAYAKVECPAYLDIPLLPYRTKKGKLIFPTGKFEGWYCTPELKKAKQLGYKIEIMEGYIFQKRNIFKKHINKLYEIKKASKSGSVDYITSKLLMNSLYGKFGQRRTQRQIVMFPKDCIGLTPMDHEGLSGIFYREIESKATHILPAIASFVTSYARVNLYEYIEKAQALGGNIYYCDTDSIVTDVVMQTGVELGNIKDEMPDGIDEGIFLLPKMYAIKQKNGSMIKCKGFPRDIFDYNIFKIALETNDYSAFSFEKQKIGSPFESMRRNKTFVSMLKFSRRVLSKYDKREVVEGFNTIPVTIAES